jgi:hypothetical protein
MTRLTVLALVLVGCGGGKGGKYTIDDIDPGLPAGTIGGQAWEMVTADVAPDSFDDAMLSVNLFGEEVEACGFATSSELPFVLFSIEPKVGEYPLSFSLTEGGQTVTLVVPPSQNNIASEGIVHVIAASDTEVEIGLVAVMDDDNTINGTFVAEICPDDGF